MHLFSTLYKVDPTAVNECTEKVALERIEEKCICLENEKKEENQDKEAMISHAIRALQCMSRIISVLQGTFLFFPFQRER